MLDDPNTALSLAPWQRVVERRNKVKEYHCCGEETRTENECSISMLCGVYDEKWRSDKCGNQTYTVADAVRDFFSFRLTTLGI